jgi:YesN/AraC family two-component response regulator
MAELLFLCCNSLSNGIFFHQSYHRPDNLPLAKSVHINSISHNLADNDEELAFLKSLETGNEELSNQFLFRFIHNIINDDTDASLLQAKTKALALSVWLAKITRSLGLSDGDSLLQNLTLIQEIQQKKTSQELEAWLVNLSDVFATTVFKLDHLKHGEFIARALRYINQNYHRNISLEDVANIAQLSPSYFSRVFKQEMNLSFTEYLNTIRIEESKKLLKEAKKNLSDIALAVGFADQSYYTKIFKRIVGVGPGKYRHYLKQS